MSFAVCRCLRELVEPAISDFLIQQSTIHSNHSAGNGGGLGVAVGLDNNLPNVVSIVGSTFSHNTADKHGGGVFLDTVNGNLLTHSTLTENQSDEDGSGFGYGGGIFVAQGSLKLLHSIVANNTDNTDLGPDITGFLGGTVEPRYSLIGTSRGNRLAEDPNKIRDSRGNIIGGLNFSIDPRLGPLAYNGGPTMTHAIQLGSLAKDAGNPNAVAGADGVPLFDQRGAPFGRVVGGRIDIGAFEFQPVNGTYEGNFDGDRDADGADFLAWQRGYGITSEATKADGDATGDGKVDSTDWPC